MDYEKKYNEALERAREWYAANTNEGYRGIFEEIFPELNETEDEKIRKEILDYIIKGSESYYDIQQYGRGKFGKWITWLENQCEQKPVEWGEEDENEYNHILKILNLVAEEQETKGYNNLISSANWLKSIKDRIQSKPRKKKSEQKSANKIEPKFEVGDWIVQENIGVYKVIEVCECWYEVVDNRDKNYSIGFDKEYMLRLWTINDAKDGDVLATEPIEGYYSPFVAICKERDLDSFNSHCFIGFDGKFYEGEEGHTIGDIHPATKEQRDLLFQKMKEAGYEWDIENKKLTTL